MELEIGIEDLLSKRRIESDRIEWKAGWNPDDIYHSVCAFAKGCPNICWISFRKKWWVTII